MDLFRHRPAPQLAWLRAVAWALAWLGVCAACATPVLAAEGSCVKTVRWTEELPYASRQPDGTVRGVDADTAAEALHRLGCSATFVQLPWARALQRLEEGTLDVLPNAFQTPQRERFAHFSRPYISTRNMLFALAPAGGAPQPAALDRLSATELRVGVQSGASYGPEFDALLPDPRFVRRLVNIRDLSTGWKMMALQRLDGQLADEFAGLLSLRADGVREDIRAVDLGLARSAGKFALSRRTNSQEFVQEFDRALEAMVKDGTYLRILSQHLPCKASAKVLGCD